VTFRNAKKSDIPAMSTLWRSSFDDEHAYISLFFKDLFKPGRAVLACRDIKPLAMAMLLPCTLKLGEESFPLAYMYAMCVDESERGKGTGKALLEYTASFSKDKGFDGIALLPADDGLSSFYGKAGYIDYFSPDSPEGNIIIYPEDYMQHLKNIAELLGGEFEPVIRDKVDREKPMGMLLRLNDNIPKNNKAFMPYPMD
jgi:predicted N-acetyltransferase YhbS